MEHHARNHFGIVEAAFVLLTCGFFSALQQQSLQIRVGGAGWLACVVVVPLTSLGCDGGLHFWLEGARRGSWACAGADLHGGVGDLSLAHDSQRRAAGGRGIALAGDGSEADSAADDQLLHRAGDRVVALASALVSRRGGRCGRGRRLNEFSEIEGANA